MATYADGTTEARIGDVVTASHVIAYGKKHEHSIPQGIGCVVESIEGDYRIRVKGIDWAFMSIKFNLHSRSAVASPPTHEPPALTLEDAKAQRRCRICGESVGDGRTAWTYNFGKEYAHTSCLHFSEVAGIQDKAPSPANAEPLVKWPEETMYKSLERGEYFVYLDDPQVPCVSLGGGQHIQLIKTPKWPAWTLLTCVVESMVPVRRIQRVGAEQFEVI